MSAGDAALLQVRDVALSLEGRPVLGGVSFDVHAGQWVALVGPNGAGKSSLLAVLAGLCRPERGAVHWLGQALHEIPGRQRAAQIAWLAQSGHSVPGAGGGAAAAGGESELAARDIVALGRLPRHGLLGQPDGQDHAAVHAAMAETESLPFVARRLAALSGGERQRVLLARALAVQPRLFLFDEPALHLDAPHQRALLAGLAARARQGAAALAVMHDLSAALMADRVIVLERGRLVADGAPADAALRAQLIETFGHAFDIEEVPQRSAQGRPRWVVVPLP